jgi:GT2 family glycosyltransferase
MDAQPVASIVLPTHGRRASLLRVLRALGRQRVVAGTFEVIVICDGDVDGSAQACRALAAELPFALRVLEQANQGPASARNLGVREAQAPLIIFLDDDVVPDEQFVAMHLKAHEGQDRRVTIGPLLPPPDFRLNAWGAWEERTLCRQYDDMKAGVYQATRFQFYTGNAAVLKRHIQDAGGFDPGYRRAEDVELALRLDEHGLHFVFLPEARGWHYVARTFESWLKMPVAYGHADVKMASAGRPELLGRVATHYRDRVGPVRLLIQLCAGRPAMMIIAVNLLGLLAKTADRTYARTLGHAACSLIFNLRYYDAVASELGNRSALMYMLR